MKKQGMIRVNGKVQTNDIQSNEPDRTNLHANGTPYTANAAKGLIKNFWMRLRPGNILLMETLLLRLVKKVFFQFFRKSTAKVFAFIWFAKSDADMGDPTKPVNWENGLTLVAIGVDGTTGKEIGVVGNTIADNIEQVDNDDPKASVSSGPIVETVPPTPGPVGLFKAYISSGKK